MGKSACFFGKNIIFLLTGADCDLGGAAVPCPVDFYKLFKRIPVMADKAQPEKGEDFYHYDVGNQLNIQLKPLQTNEAACYGQHGSDTKAGQLTQ